MAQNRAISFDRLMSESEKALWQTEAQPEYYRVPVSRLLDNQGQYRMWEASHARHMRNVADYRRQSQQAMALRKIAMQFIHRRGLFDYLRTFRVRGAQRQQLFRVFYGLTDFHDAALLEHRQYVLAASSGYCIEVLVDRINDSNGFKLLERYQWLYSQYFEIFSQYVRADFNADTTLADALRPTMLEYRAHTNLIRRQILSLPPLKGRITPAAAQRIERAETPAISR
jgi:hypothetical protein